MKYFLYKKVVNFLHNKLFSNLTTKLTQKTVSIVFKNPLRFFSFSIVVAAKKRYYLSGILAQCSISILPENIKRPMIFRHFQGV